MDERHTSFKKGTAPAISTGKARASFEIPAGALIINADDWGRDTETTDHTLDCFLAGAVSSVSAMTFMQDSERAAELARDRGVDAALHLNFTTRFSARGCPANLLEHQGRLCRYLKSSRLAQLVYHPGLASSFQYVVASQLDEFRKLYGLEPQRLDGHHHMHLCANVLLANLLPEGTLVRRNFSFAPGEKAWMNRRYRAWVDGRLKRRHRLVDFLFALAPVDGLDRLQRIFVLAQRAVVELETHPVNPDEYRFLTSSEAFRQLRSPSVVRTQVVSEYEMFRETASRI
jgi:hypothetical protein